LKPKYSKILVYVALGLICLIAPSILFYLFGHLYFPPHGGDIGDWLRYAYGLFENRYPLWDNNPWQYPPFALIIIYLLAKLTSELTAVRLMGLLLMGLLPIPMFLLGKKLTGKDSLALLIAFLTATSGIYYDMYSWGSLPNLLGFVFLPLTFLYMLKLIQNETLSNLFYTSILSILVVLTHHLTTIILLMTLGFLTLFSLMKRQKMKNSIVTILIPTSVFLLYRFSVGSNEFISFNESAWYKNYFYFPVAVWVFKDVMLLIVFTVLAVLGFIWIYRDNEHMAVLFGAWTISPYLFCLLWIPKLVAIDFHRLPIFALQPTTVLALFSIYRVLKSKQNIEIPTRALSVSILTILILTSFFSGPIIFSQNVIKYYAKSDYYVYEPVMWVKNNTEPLDTIVTREGLVGRWIEGVDHRRVLIYGAPRFQFIRGQYKMCIATETALTSNILYQNDMFKIKDQTPVLFEKTPFIYLYHEGSYELLGFLCDQFFQISWEDGTESLGWGYAYKGYNISKIDFSYVVHYITPHFEVTKTISLSADNRVDIQYIVENRGDTAVANISLPFWLYKNCQPSYTNGTLSTNIGNVILTTNAIDDNLIFSPAHDKYKIVLEFEPQGNETAIYLSLTTSNKRLTSNNRLSFTTSVLIEHFNLTYALISKTDQEVKRWLTIQPELWDLAYDGEVYQIYRLVQSGQE